MLKGKVAIITGGAQGIGKHAAKTLAEHSAKVIIADLDLATAEKTAQELGEVTEAAAILLDVRDENAVRNAFEMVVSKHGQIDILVNNAAVVPHFSWGVPRWPCISEMSFEQWDRVIRTNLYGTFFCSKHVIPHLRARNGGHIINLWGGGGTKPPGALTYAVTKDSIRTFTRFLAEEVRDSNICVVSISPGAQIATETAPETAKKALAGPEILGSAFVLAAQLSMDASGLCWTHKDGELVPARPMAG
jgi:NAD(P)-dependent dehydrogenase (short-subunit alcohol dehydrogenase family)